MGGWQDIEADQHMLEAEFEHSTLTADRHEDRAGQVHMPHVLPADIRASPPDIIVCCEPRPPSCRGAAGRLLHERGRGPSTRH